MRGLAPTRWRWRPGSGPLVADLFHRLFAAIFLLAFGSLLVQIDVLIGHAGLLPIDAFMASLRARGTVTLTDFPTHFWWFEGETAMRLGLVVGMGFALAGALGQLPRLCVFVCGALYLSYVTACRSFLSFQWDNMLLECALLALFLPRHRPSAWAHLLFRLLLFKLYFESGVAKWQSHLQDWHDGSAMTFYYETAPIPTALAWWFHDLPEAWHHFESRAALGLELLAPWLIFGPRPLRLVAFLSLTGFQLLDLTTANYGFFCYLSLCLHVFLLDERDIVRLRSLVGRILGRRGQAQPPPSPPPRWARANVLLGAVVVSAYASMSTVMGLAQFTENETAREAMATLRPVIRPWRLVHNYHLFGHITRERIEPEFQTYDGGRWSPQHFKYKPGPTHRPPPFVAPHQPRVDFRLWFFGLSFRRGMPDYVSALVDRLCHDPGAVQALFAEPLPADPTQVRIAFWRYEFTTPEERSQTGDFWRRSWIGAYRPQSCAGP